MADNHPAAQSTRVPPPTKHQLALMIWLSVFPTLLLINVALGDWLRSQPSVVRTLVLTSIAVPIVIYGLMPQLHRVRARLVMRRFGGDSVVRHGSSERQGVR